MEIGMLILKHLIFPWALAVLVYRTIFCRAFLNRGTSLSSFLKGGLFAACFSPSILIYIPFPVPAVWSLIWTLIYASPGIDFRFLRSYLPFVFLPIVIFWTAATVYFRIKNRLAAARSKVAR